MNVYQCFWPGDKLQDAAAQVIAASEDAAWNYLHALNITLKDTKVFLTRLRHSGTDAAGETQHELDEREYDYEVDRHFREVRNQRAARMRTTHETGNRCNEPLWCRYDACPDFDWYRMVGVDRGDLSSPNRNIAQRFEAAWLEVFIALRNVIGDMEYDDCGARDYRAPLWRARIAHVFDRIAYRGSPPALIAQIRWILGGRPVSDDIPF